LEDVGIFYGHLGYFETIWCIFSGFGIVHQEKSGNPAEYHARDDTIGEKWRISNTNLYTQRNWELNKQAYKIIQ
jgi:hypothetical protein